jgi:hypothetical protein
MDLSEMYNNKMIIIGVAVVIIIVCVAIYFYFRKENRDSLEKMNTVSDIPKVKPINLPQSTEKEFTKGKVINYFGGKNCPHSNVNSMMYKIVFDKLKNKYQDVNINLFWNDEKQEKFKENNIEFVPTLVSRSNKKINVKLTPDLNADDYNDEELENIFLKNIYDQL